MYYKKLIDTYRETDCHLEYPEQILEVFDNFIRDEKKLDHKYLNPYKFALTAKISIAESIKFFLYFSGENNLIHPLPFFDCFNSSCSGVRIFLNQSEQIEEEMFLCEECGNVYDYEDVKKFILLYFELNPEIEIPLNQKHLSSKDPNSTYDILDGLPDNLKVKSPSSTVNIDEGEHQNEAISLDQALEQNYTVSGNQIIDPNNLFEIKLRERLSKGRRL